MAAFLGKIGPKTQKSAMSYAKTNYFPLNSHNFDCLQLLSKYCSFLNYLTQICAIMAAILGKIGPKT